MANNRSDNNFLNSRGNHKRFPLLPLRDIVIFPHMVIPLFVGRKKSILALQAAMLKGKTIFLATQKNAQVDEPGEDDIYVTGTLCHIIQLLKLPDNTIKVLVEGKSRGKIIQFLPEQDYIGVKIEHNQENNFINSEIEALMRGAKSTFATYCKLSKNISPEILCNIKELTEPSLLADSIVVHVNLKIDDKQDLLATFEPQERLEKLLNIMGSEIEILQIESKIHNRVKKQMERTQREYYLNEQMRAIQKELGGKDDFKQEIQELEEKIVKQELSKEAKQKVLSEIRKLKFMSPMSAEAAVVRNYVDWLVSLPWDKSSTENDDTLQAEDILNADHYGLDKVKERILEYLSVHARVKTNKGPILCLVGPPGVGKTSLARSIARATGRNFIKMSLGGLRDEAEIRGHRRTYVGAMPGKIIQNLKKAGTSNPLFLLDEIDKMSSDFRGDPASALLEVLDPEQNATFNDLFLDVDYDLSKVMFITTANSFHSIPRPLLDRLEVIKIEGYTESEKLAIARQYLVKKQLKLHGLQEQNVTFSNRALTEIIRYYTREAGVRNLEREIANVCRKTVRRIAKVDGKKTSVQPGKLKELLGPRRFSISSAEDTDSIGIVIGMAWTETGGDLLTIEVAVVPGQGKLTITGKLGEVMQESVQAALTYVRSRSDFFGLERNFYKDVDVHVHVPEGAIPKDGPSAGISIATAIASALTRKPVKRDVAMTGEITLRGRVLPIGGLKEKILAAKMGNIKTVLLPVDNKKDVSDFPDEIVKGLKIFFVEHMDEVVSFSISGAFSESIEPNRMNNDSQLQEAVGAAH
jgi:ATP-dependent Lon protease